MKRVFLFLFVGVVCTAQTLMLTGPANARPGETVTVAVAIASPGANLAALQWDVGLPSGFTATALGGAASVAASKTLVCNGTATRCLTYGVNIKVYGPGLVATYEVVIPTDQPAGVVAFPLSGLVGARLDGSSASVVAGAAYSLTILANTDLNGDGVTDVEDIQILIPIILGPIAANCPVPQNTDLVCNVLDLQLVARAAVGA